MTPEDDGFLVFQVFNEIGIINQLSSAEFRKVLGSIGQAEFGVLNHFVRLGDGKTPSELARNFQVSRPSMTATLNSLERRGFIEIKPGETDRRTKYVTLTPEGRAAREKAIADVMPMAGRSLDGFGGEAFAALLPQLVALRRYLDEARDGDGSDT